MESVSSVNGREKEPLLAAARGWDQSASDTIARRQIRRSTALSIAILSFGVLLFLGIIIQVAFTSMTKESEIPINNDDDGAPTQSYSVRVWFLFVFAGGLAIVSIVAGVRITRIVSLEGQSIERELSWAGTDIHGLSAGGLAISCLTAIASVIAVVSFQNFNQDSGGEFQFNITESVGWMLIGCMALLMMGLYSSTELDARALLGKLIQTHTARTRAITLTQLVFSIQAFVVALPLLFTNIQFNALLVVGAIVTFGAALLGFVSCALVLSQLTFLKWPAGVRFLMLDRSWGTSVASHCLSLIACGLHIFFGVEAIYTCSSADDGSYRPNCDANIGSLTAILPFVFNIITMIMLGVTSIVAAVRVGSLSREYAHGEFNATDELLHSSDFISTAHEEDSQQLMDSPALRGMSAKDLSELFNSAVEGSGDMLESAMIDGKVLCLMLSAAPAPWQTCPQTIEILSEASHVQLTRITAARILSSLHDVVKRHVRTHSHRRSVNMSNA
eukprot:m.34677 g.34677  ORF g.34677 m.34677 type:complete len:502 (-) comp9942_c0_seq1:77-1582(-)